MFEKLKIFEQLRSALFTYDKQELAPNRGLYLPGMEVVHKWERDLTVVVHHIHQTSAVVDIHPDRELKGLTEVLPSSWVGVLGSPTVFPLELEPVVMEVGICQGRGQEEVVDNTGVPEVAEAL